MNNNIYVYGDIIDGSGLVEQIQELNGADEINVYINTMGGSVQEGIAIINALAVCLLGKDFPLPCLKSTRGVILYLSYGLSAFIILRNILINIKSIAGINTNNIILESLFIKRSPMHIK